MALTPCQRRCEMRKTLIAPLDQIDVHSFLAPDNEFMGAAVAQVLMDQIGAKESW
jgi:hypothetical protein